MSLIAHNFPIMHKIKKTKWLQRISTIYVHKSYLTLLPVELLKWALFLKFIPNIVY